MKTTELDGPDLDQRVALECRVRGHILSDHNGSWTHRRFVISDSETEWSPSKDWSIAGPLIERERITIAAVGATERRWYAEVAGSQTGEVVKVGFGKHNAEGPTPLVAAMRAFVRSRIGEDCPT